MLKTLMISAAISALMVSGALTQADMSNQPAAKTDAAPHDTAKFIAAQSPDQWVFSKFKGTDVIGPDNAQVGNVNDMLFDKNGKILGLIVGVGGLGGAAGRTAAHATAAWASCCERNTRGAATPRRFSESPEFPTRSPARRPRSTS